MAIPTNNGTGDINPSNTIITSVSIYYILFFIGWIIFEIIRDNLQDLYSCRKRSEATTCPPVEKTYGFFGWIFPVLKISDENIFEYCGLDTMCFLRLLRLGEKLALCGICLSFFLFPWYATGIHPHEDERNEIDPLERITMSNLSKNDYRLWGSVIAMYIMTIYAMYLFLNEYKIYIKHRHEFLSRNGPQQYSVVINDLPKHLRTNDTLKSYMDYLFPGHVHSVHVAIECKDLEKYVEKRIKVRNALEHALAIYGSTGNRPFKSKSKCGGGGDKIDSINYYQSKLDTLNNLVGQQIRKIEIQGHEIAHRILEQGQGTTTTTTGLQLEGIHINQQQDGGGGGGGDDRIEHEQTTLNDTTDDVENISTKFKHSRTAFVCFNTLTSAQTIQQLLQTNNPIEMEVKGAPHPTDVVWENIGLSRHERNSWQFISWAITIGIILFWTIPTTFVASLSTVEKLREIIPPLDSMFDTYPWLKEFVKQLSPILLVVMSSLAVYIFGYLSRREGHPSLTQVNASLFSKLVYFQIFQIFFVSVIAGTVLDSLEKIINEPKLIVQLLGATMPAQSTTFMSYLIVQAGLKLTLELFRVIALILGLIYKCFAPKLTQRERASPWFGLKSSNEPGIFDQTIILPNYFLAILLIFAFCAIAPLLCYFAGIFLFMSDIIYRRQVLFVYDPTKYSTGVYWPKLHDFLIGALILAQITLLGLVTIKLTPIPIFLSTILPFFTIAYYFYINSLWPRTGLYLPLSHCCKLDRGRGERDFELGNWDRAFVQPVFAEIGQLNPEYNEHGKLSVVQLVSSSSNNESDDGDDRRGDDFTLTPVVSTTTTTTSKQQ